MINFLKKIFIPVILIGLNLFLVIYFTLSIIKYGKYHLGKTETKKTGDIITIGKGEKTDDIIIFSSPNCHVCQKIQIELLPMIASELQIKIRYINFNIDHAENFNKFMKLSQNYNKKLKLPAVFTSKNALGGEESLFKELKNIIKREVNDNSGSVFNKINSISIEKDYIPEIFAGIPALTMISAGLLDGVNPCAFTTIIFLISYLGIAGRKGKEIIMTGSAFTIGVFITYLAIGMGAYTFIGSISSAALIGQIIKYLCVLFVVVLSFYSVIDYVKCIRGQTTEISLQLPKSIKKILHYQIRESVKKRYIMISAFVLGIVVSFFELACTGQIYLPIIIYMTKYSLSAYFYLTLYNIMFILPLIIVFFLAYMGFVWIQFSDFFKKRISLIKVLTTLLYIGIGFLLLYI